MAPSESNNSDVRQRNSSDAAPSPRPSIIGSVQRNRSQSASANPITSPTTPTQTAVNSSSTAPSRRSTKLNEDNRIPSVITMLSNGTRGTLIGRKKDRSHSRSRSGSLRQRGSFESVNSTVSTQPNVTVVPPSPQVASYELSDSEGEEEIVPEEEVVTPTAPKPLS